MNNVHKTVFLKDYNPFPFSITSFNLDFQLAEGCTVVSATSECIREAESPHLHLKGEELELQSLLVNGGEWPWEKEDGGIVVKDVPDQFTLHIVTRIYPEKNKALEGLYRSSGIYCTQCEAEGFRKITFFPDRPDVLTRYTTRIEADKATCPVLLANGNLIQQGDCDNGRHFAVWEDPFAKPSYLFALVAGELYPLEEQFITKSGRKVALKIFVEKQNQGRCDHAMASLKKAMRWDEDVFGLEYDLDTFMIVAVDDFNMGAMENKGLNIFNSKYVLTSPESATDEDYLGVESVIAHEYFHNWTGNRVTCRDWFQLSLKEGLTVFRDQEFSADMNSRAIQRIDDVNLLKAVQFKEDSGPMAHPVRPDNYLEINNFYTATVYNKGAEVIRMIHTLIGADNFRKGMDLYFKRHDGGAVTCEDFVAAMADASGKDLSQFFLWYQQAGTPKLTVRTSWDAGCGRYEIEIEQSCADTPGQSDKKPFHIPIVVSLFDMLDGFFILDNDEIEKVLELRKQKEKFVFDDLPGTEKPTLSFLRDFSAPVEVENFLSDEELSFLASDDTDKYNQWDCIQRLAEREILRIATSLQKNEKEHVDSNFLDVIYKIVGENCTDDPALLARFLLLPTESVLAQKIKRADPEALHVARELVMAEIASKCERLFLRLYERNQTPGSYSIDPETIGKRSLKNTMLRYLICIRPLPEKIAELPLVQFQQAENMTDSIAALGCLNRMDGSIRQQAFDDFYRKWRDNPLVLDKWFRLQAVSPLANTLDRVKELLKDPAFSLTNPNRVRALIGSFCAGNHYRFHEKDGAGYRFLADKITELNSINPQIASRLLSPLVGWKRYEPTRARLMQQQLQRIAAVKELSKDVYEVVNKSLTE